MQTETCGGEKSSAAGAFAQDLSRRLVATNIHPMTGSRSSTSFGRCARYRHGHGVSFRGKDGLSWREPRTVLAGRGWRADEIWLVVDVSDRKPRSFARKASTSTACSSTTNRIRCVLDESNPISSRLTGRPFGATAIRSRILNEFGILPPERSQPRVVLSHMDQARGPTRSADLDHRKKAGT